jgi:hypothetical protein
MGKEGEINRHCSRQEQRQGQEQVQGRLQFKKLGVEVGGATSAKFEL